MVSFCPDQLPEALAIAGFGILGISLVTGVLIGTVALLNKLTK